MTLAETLVAGIIFTGLLVLVVVINRVSREAMQKTDVHAETFRRCAVALDQIRRELLGARVDADRTTASRLVYQRPPEGTLPVQPSGAIAYTAPYSTISVDGVGDLLRVDPTTGLARRLAALGPGGGATFTLRDPRLLRVAVRAAISDAYHRAALESVTDLTADVFLGNQP